MRVTAEQARQEFESCHRSWDLRRGEHGEYLNHTVAACWTTWFVARNYTKPRARKAKDAKKNETT